MVLKPDDRFLESKADKLLHVEKRFHDRVVG